MRMWPIMLRVEGRRAVVVGGGEVGKRRARGLRDAGAEVVMICEAGGKEVEGIEGVEVVRRPFEERDVDGAMVVVAATDDVVVNERVAEAARKRGILVNRADEGMEGDFAVPACGRMGEIVVAVGTGGGSAAAGARIRDEVMRKLDGEWERLIAFAGGKREEVKVRLKDRRTREAVMRRMVDEGAMAALKVEGEAGLERYWREAMEEAERG